MPLRRGEACPHPPWLKKNTYLVNSMVFICLYNTFAFGHIWAYLCLSMCIHLYLYASISLYISISLCLYTSAPLNLFISVYLYMSISLYIFVFLNICIYLYLCISNKASKVALVDRRHESDFFLNWLKKGKFNFRTMFFNEIPVPS